jgi:hypothetical protein
MIGSFYLAFRSSISSSDFSVDEATEVDSPEETGWRLFDLNYGRGLPYDLREGIALNKSSFFVLENSWSTKGAQEFPLGVVIVNSTSIGSVLDDTSVVYVGGPTENRVYAVLSR